MRKFFITSVLIAINLTPLLGVVLLDWNLATIFFLYWIESIIVGFFNILKMRFAQKPIKQNLTMPKNKTYSLKEKNMALIIAFISNYGVFILGYGLFLYIIFWRNYHINKSVIISVILLFIGHSITYYTSYIRNMKYKLVSADELIKDPYFRIFILNITLVFGSLIIIKSGEQNISYIIVLTTMTIIEDLVITLTKDSKYFTKNIAFK